MLCITGVRGQAADSNPYPHISGILANRCVACHGPTVQEAGLRLDALAWDFADQKSRDAWLNVARLVSRGEMPPQEKPQLTPDEIGFIDGAVRSAVEHAAITRDGGAGRSPMRRLTRDEYAAHVLNVLGLSDLPGRVDLAQRLPADPSGHGFSNDGQTLVFQEMHVQAYFDALERALATVLPDPDAESPAFAYVVEPETLKIGGVYRKQANKWLVPMTGASTQPDGDINAAMVVAGSTKLTEDGRGLIFPPVFNFGDSMGEDKGLDGTLYITYPQVMTNGTIRVRIRAAAMVRPGGGPANLRLGLQNLANKQYAYLPIADIPISHAEWRDYEVDLHLDLIDFPYVTFVNGRRMGIRIGNRYAPVRGRPKVNAKSDSAAIAAHEAEKNTDPDLLIDRIEILGPGLLGEAHPSRRGALAAGYGNDNEDGARAALLALAGPAWRRPVTADEIEPFIALYAKRRAAGKGHNAALRHAAATLLLMPDTLFLIERKAKTMAPLNGVELANRLSFFLWSRRPDDDLLAAAPRLNDPQVLRQQAERLLADPRGRAFTHGFMFEWLSLSRIIDDAVPMRSKVSNPDRDRATTLLVRDLQAEPGHLLSAFIAADAPASRLLDSDRIAVNGRLAEWYGLEGISGDSFQLAPAPGERRHGLMTMSGVIIAASRGHKEAQIYRGVYVLDALLGEPPGVPPPGVPPLPQEKGKKRGPSGLRERLAEHTNTASCQTCHRKIDPLGFVWEQYDAFGVPIRDRAGSLTPANTAGQLPDRTPFADLAGFVAAINTPESPSRHRFHEVLVRRLMSYALGRSLTLADDAQVAELMRGGEATQWRLRQLILDLIASRCFTHG